MKCDDLSKEARIYTEIKRLNGLFKMIDPKMKKLVKSLIENAAFMTITLEDIQKDINSKGYTEEYQNGENQWGTKKTPEADLYNTMIKNHTSVMKQLTDLLPKDDLMGKGADKDDGFEQYVAAKQTR